jgi:hypothetical protein
MQIFFCVIIGAIDAGFGAAIRVEKFDQYHVQEQRNAAFVPNQFSCLVGLRNEICPDAPNVDVRYFDNQIPGESFYLPLGEPYEEGVSPRFVGDFFSKS